MRLYINILAFMLIATASKTSLAQIASMPPEFQSVAQQGEWSRLHSELVRRKEYIEALDENYPNSNLAEKERAVKRFDLQERKLIELCDQGLGAGCSSVVRVNRGTPKGYKYSILACQRGSEDGCLEKGVMEYMGQGRKKDPIEAGYTFQKLCSIGSFQGCKTYAKFLMGYFDHPPDIPKAQKIYQRMCLEMKHEKSCQYLKKSSKTNG